MAKKGSSRSSASKRSIKPLQLDLPIGFGPNGERVTLRDATSKGFGGVASLSELNEDQRTKLVLERIQAQPKFEIAVVGAGLINKSRAIQEIKAKSDIGRLLIEIEQQAISNLLDAHQK